jgi:hypothetical protein
MAVKLSKTSKLGTFSWSLQAVETCPGSADASQPEGLVKACQGCYARTGMYNFPGVKAPRAANKEDWQRAEWVADMVAALKKQTHFRWFDSGDMYALELAEKMLAVMTATPQVKHWLPTRMHKFPKFAAVIAAMMALPNVMVRPSSDAVDGTYTDGVHGSTIVPMDTPTPTGVILCCAPEQGGKCLDCRACYNKSVAVIGYIAHGKKMAKVIRIAQAVAA